MDIFSIHFYQTNDSFLQFRFNYFMKLDVKSQVQNSLVKTNETKYRIIFIYTDKIPKFQEKIESKKMKYHKHITLLNTFVTFWLLILEKCVLSKF